MNKDRDMKKGARYTRIYKGLIENKQERVDGLYGGKKT